MQRRRDLFVTNMVALVVLLAALLLGWREAAAIGLAVLVLLDLMVLFRGHPAPPEDDRKE